MNTRRLLAITGIVAAGIAGAGWSSASAQIAAPPAPLKIAFIGDQGLGTRARAVLSLIAAEGADAVVHSGDFDYHDDPLAWEAMIDEVLGPDYPYFASIGNHDTDAFFGPGGYQERLAARLDRLGITWQGDLGVQSVLSYEGITLLLTAPGIVGPGDGDHELFIGDVLAADTAMWRISSWHKNMRRMQVGTKADETGWGVYEASRRGGALIATAHNHAYARTHLMASFELQTIASTDAALVLSRDDPQTAADEGRSTAFVSGLGGKSVRGQARDDPWWASIYTSDQGALPGALFATFHYAGDARLAYLYFKDIAGVVADEFYLRTALFEATTSTTVTTTSSLPVPVPRCGDFNGDARISASDALGILIASVGLVACDMAVCDVDGTGDVSASDALTVLRLSTGTSVTLRCPQPLAAPIRQRVRARRPAAGGGQRTSQSP